MQAVGALTIRLFEAGDAFRLLGAVGAVSGAEKIVTIAGGYETRDGGEFELEFRGPVSDAQPLKEFLEPQLRDAASKNLEVGFELVFAEGLPMHRRCTGEIDRTARPVRERRRVCVGDGGGEDVDGTRLERVAQIQTPDSAPQYELRVRRHGPADAEFEVWQMPAIATPRVTSALRDRGASRSQP